MTAGAAPHPHSARLQSIPQADGDDSKSIIIEHSVKIFFTFISEREQKIVTDAMGDAVTAGTDLIEELSKQPGTPDLGIMI